MVKAPGVQVVVGEVALAMVKGVSRAAACLERVVEGGVALAKEEARVAVAKVVARVAVAKEAGWEMADLVEAKVREVRAAG